MAYRKWTPSKTAKREFAQKMNDIDDFCREHGIHQSARSDSYYFTINGKSYRVSNHSVEASNARAFTDLGEQIREKYHPDGREEDVIYIHASKTRIKEIYNNLVAGYELDGRGNIKESPHTDRKYELTDIRQSVSISGESLYRIKALKEFENEATGVVIEKGQLGGFVQSEKNLSQDGTCWIDDNARVFNNAKVTDNAYVGDESMISLNAEVTDNAVVKESAWITQNAKITDKAFVTGTVMVKGNAVIKDEAIVCGNQSINGNTEISTGIHDGTAALAQITVQSQNLEM